MVEKNKYAEHQTPPLGGRGVILKRKIYISLLLLTTIFFFVLGIVWMGLVLLITTIFCYVWSKYSIRWKHWKGYKIVRNSTIFFGIFFLSIFIRLFVLEVYEIPSGSMENTLIPGDKILVNKLIIGPQTPKSPFDIPWVNLFFYMNKQARTNIDSTWWEPKRLKGWADINRNDVLVFKHKPVTQKHLVKRCVALPGDELQIRNSYIYINGKFAETNELPNVMKKWFIYPNHLKSLDHLVDSLQLNRFYQDYRNNELKRTFVLTNSEVVQLMQYPIVDSIHAVIEKPNKNAWFYPKKKKDLWSLDNYGPFRIPYKGWKITLNDSTVNLYCETISKWENKKIEIINRHFYIDEKEVVDYTFQNNYYFFMGDCRNNTIDSRKWGIIPKQKIEGKASHILWSNNNYTMIWNRILKRIR